MIPYETYKIVHLFGIMLAMVALGGVSLHALNGGQRGNNAGRRLVSIGHGVGAFLVLLGGFGMLARKGIVTGHAFPGWIWVKIGVWLVISAIVLLPYRRPALARPVYLGVPLLGMLAAYMAIHHPI